MKIKRAPIQRSPVDPDTPLKRLEPEFPTDADLILEAYRKLSLKK